MARRTASEDTGTSGPSLKDPQIQKNLTFERFFLQITAMTWFQSMLTACPRLIYQYSNMDPSLSRQNCYFFKLL